MRPERLELEGFTAFREPTVVDFTGADLFALTGPTGAGKSSLIDAICFALYGIVPRYDDKRLVAPVISQGQLEAKVRLDFSVGKERYSAVRVVRGQKTGATTKEARLVRDSDGEVLAGNADELTAQVEQLLGLSFEHFTTCVVLPQGDFAKFLHHKPKDRQQLLVNLLDLLLYEQMRSLAREREVAAKGARELIESRLADQRELASPERQAEVEARIEAFDAVLKCIDDVEPQIVELTGIVEKAEADKQRLSDEIRRLDAVRLPEGLAELADELVQANRAVEVATKAEEQAAVAVDEQEKLVASMTPRASLEGVARLHDERDHVRERISKGEAVVAEREAECASTAAARQAAQQAFDEAQRALDEARLADRAHELVLTLEVGADCPVCGQAVHELPAHEATAFADVQKKHKASESKLRGADQAAQNADTERQKAVALLDDVRARLTQLDEALAETAGREDVVAKLAALDEAEADLTEKRRVAKAAQDQRRKATKQIDALSRRQSDARTAFLGARDKVGALDPPPVADDLLADWTTLLDWAAAELPKRAELVEATDQLIAEARTAHQRLFDEVFAEADAKGIDLDPDRPARDSIADQRAAAVSERVRIVAARQQVEQYTKELADVTEREDVAHALARHLSANGFEKWVLDAALRRLASSATGILYELSGQTYSLTLDDKSNFCVIDHANADARRSARTLSGGETFLTSLALALALADQVAQLAAGGAARLESIFLDEGFGTLDADTLDTVATAIEHLGAEGRMVGLISHVPDLAERLPTRFEVVKTGSSSTVTRVDS